MIKADVWVVTVNLNGMSVLGSMLSSVTALDRGKVNLHILLVDNASSDGSAEFVAKNFSEVHVIRQNENTGFAKGNNIGIRYAMENGAEFIWLLNNDTTADRKALKILEAFRDPSVGAASSKIYFAKGAEYRRSRYRKEDLGKVIWYAGGLIDWANVYASHRGVDEVDHGQFDLVEETEFATGCSLMLARTSLQRVGFFDERYFLYLEDVDLSVRMKKAGFKIIYYPGSLVWHNNASSSGGPGSVLHTYYQTRNRLLFGMKHAPWKTKFALIRQAGRHLSNGTQTEKEAVKDAIRGHYGKKPEI
jgi:hypothetical protein